MAALSALLPIASSEKAQQSPNKQESFVSAKSTQKATKEPENKAGSKESEQKRDDKPSEFSVIYNDDLRAYGEAQPLENQSTAALNQSDESVQFSLLEGNALPPEGETLPLGEEVLHAIPIDSDSVANAMDALPLAESSEIQSPKGSEALHQATTVPSLAAAANDGDAQTTAETSVTIEVEPTGQGLSADTGAAKDQHQNLAQQQPAIAAIAASDAVGPTKLGGSAEVTDTVTAATVIEKPLDTSQAGPALGDSDASAMQVNNAVASDQIVDDAELAAAAPKAELADKQKEQADVVKAWRGTAPKEGSVMQSGNTGESLRPMPTSAGQGQLQQFAESLRLPQVSVEGATMTGEKGASTVAGASQSAESVQAWRQESSGQPQSIPGRVPQNTNFAQTMQAHNFNSKFGHTFGTSQWAESVSQRVSMMAAQRLGSAQIELDPPELGAMTVKISLDGDKASVNFMSANSQVRDALEQTFPRLQEMLGQQGLQLADAHVSDNPSTGQNTGGSQASGNGRGREEGEGSLEDEPMRSVNVPTGLIDYYA